MNNNKGTHQHQQRQHQPIILVPSSSSAQIETEIPAAPAILNLSKGNNGGNVSSSSSYPDSSATSSSGSAAAASFDYFYYNNQSITSTKEQNLDSAPKKLYNKNLYLNAAGRPKASPTIWVVSWLQVMHLIPITFCILYKIYLLKVLHKHRNS